MMLSRTLFLLTVFFALTGAFLSPAPPTCRTVPCIHCSNVKIQLQPSLVLHMAEGGNGDSSESSSSAEEDKVASKDVTSTDGTYYDDEVSKTTLPFMFCKVSLVLCASEHGLDWKNNLPTSCCYCKG